MSERKMSLKRWRALREELENGINSALTFIEELDDCVPSDMRNAAIAARDAVLKSLYEADAIQPPKGIDPS